MIFFVLVLYTMFLIAVIIVLFILIIYLFSTIYKNWGALATSAATTTEPKNTNGAQINIYPITNSPVAAQLPTSQSSTPTAQIPIIDPINNSLIVNTVAPTANPVISSNETIPTPTPTSTTSGTLETIPLFPIITFPTLAPVCDTAKFNEQTKIQMDNDWAFGPTNWGDANCPQRGYTWTPEGYKYYNGAAWVICDWADCRNRVKV